MGLENANYIGELDENNPLSTDLVSQGDDHIRMTKRATRQSFPNVNGEVTLTHEKLNSMEQDMQDYTDQKIAEAMANDLENRFGVESMLISNNPANPSTYGYPGVWVAYGQGRVLAGAGPYTDDNAVTKTLVSGDSGGNWETTLTVDQMPSHVHDIGRALNYGTSGTTDNRGAGPGSQDTLSAGGDQPHSNEQPWVAVYVWIRES